MLHGGDVREINTHGADGNLFIRCHGNINLFFFCFYASRYGTYRHICLTYHFNQAVPHLNYAKDY
jgi:hypothetical protein